MSFRIPFSFALACVSIFLAPETSALTPLDGLQDPTFGEGGRSYVDLNATTLGGGYASALAKAPSGSIYVGGSANGRFVIARLSAEGVRDLGFGSFGLASDAPLSLTNGYFSLNDLVVQPDGKPVAAGTVGLDDADVVLCRYNVAGNLDNSFDSDGCAVVGLDLIANGGEGAQAMVTQPDGKFLLVGSVETAAFNGDGRSGLLMRLHADGSLDASFGVNGYRTLNVLNRSTTINSIIRQSDGSVIVAGTYKPEENSAQSDRFVAKYTQSGALVGGFGINGIATVNFDDYVVGGDSTDIQGGLAVDSIGRVYDCGSSRSYAPSLVTLSVARYSATGQLDPNFGAGGRIYRTFNDLNDVSFAYDCLIQRERLVVSLHTGMTSGNMDMALMRFLEDGSTDPEFGAGGSMNYPINVGGNGLGHEIGTRVEAQGDHLLAYASASPEENCCATSYGYVVIRALSEVELFRDGFE